MNQKQLIEFLAIWDKLKIQADPELTTGEKELLKAFIDELKNSVK